MIANKRSDGQSPLTDLRKPQNPPRSVKRAPNRSWSEIVCDDQGAEPSDS